MKSFITLSLTLFISQIVCAQSDVFKPATQFLVYPTVNSNSVNISITKPKNGISSFRYLPQKSYGLNVIHVGETSSNLDRVYFVDQNGKTQQTTIMQTKPVNFMNSSMYGRDSFNPNGSASFGQSIANGVAYMIFNGLKVD